MSELDLTFKSKKLILAENLQQGVGVFGKTLTPLRQNIMEKIMQLAIRFEHRAEIVALDIFDPRSIPRDRSEVASYGNKELRSLFDFYSKRRTVKR